MEHEENYANKGVAGAGLGLGIAGTALGLLNGGLGNLGLGNNNYYCHENTPVNRYEFKLNQELAAKDSKIALLESNIYVDSKIADVYERLNAKIGLLEGQICQQSVINAQVTANIACMQGNINTLMALTKTVVPISSICPTPAVATTTT
jgi:hypothetical protein